MRSAQVLLYRFGYIYGGTVPLIVLGIGFGVDVERVRDQDIQAMMERVSEYGHIQAD